MLQLRSKSEAVLHSILSLNNRVQRSRNLSNVVNNNALDDLFNESQPQKQANRAVVTAEESVTSPDVAKKALQLETIGN